MQLKFPVIGLMSGTSMDGINASLSYTNGSTIKRTNHNLIYKYKKNTKETLIKAINNLNNFSSIKLKELSDLITIDHASALKVIIKKSGVQPKLIGFHGQTILHDPTNYKSLQLGNPKLLSSLIKCPVISNFRDLDLKNGGQGAPLAPIYHKYLIKEFKLTLPACIINIGGVSNLTYWDGKDLIGFDTGPGNTLIDQYCQLNLNLDLDHNGCLARKGIINDHILNLFLKNSFFVEKGPKSLDKLYFNKYLDILKIKKISAYDSLATLTAFTAYSIINSFNLLPKFPKTVVIIGGGANNNFLLSILKEKYFHNILTSYDLNLNGEMVEADLMSFISARTYYRMPSTFPQTTGTKTPIIAGKIYNYD